MYSIVRLQNINILLFSTTLIILEINAQIYLTVFISFHYTIQKSQENQRNILDGCQHVYIDLGTNIGIQIRKLYEPHLYPRASILSVFKKTFGNRTNQVCSVGFEANPSHTDYLIEFENYCLRRNWRVKIFTSMAVSTRNGNVTFYTQLGNERNNQWGASLELASSNKRGYVTVPSIDIVSWYKNTVLTRKIPSNFDEPRIMMKHDLEQHDPTVLTDFIFGGVFCTIDFIYGEHLKKEFRESVAQIRQYSKLCKTKLVYMDDESYHNKRVPFIVPESDNTTATI